MTKTWFVAVIVLAIVFAWLLQLNPTRVPFAFAAGDIREFHLVLLLLVAFLCGVATHFIISLFREGGRALQNLRSQRESNRAGRQETTYLEGLESMSRGDDEEAIRLFTELEEQHYDSENLPLHLARLQRRAGRPELALRALERGRSLYPENAKILEEIGEVYLECGRFQETRRALEELAEGKGERQADAQRRLAELNTRMLDHQAALRAFEAYLSSLGREEREKKRPGLVEYQYRAGEELCSRDDTSAARKLARQILKQAPESVLGHLLQGRVEEADDKPQATWRAWREGYRKSADPVFLERIAELAIRTDQPAEIIEEYENAIEAHPDRLEVRLLFVALLLRLEMVEKALDEVRKAEAAGLSAPALSFFQAEILDRRGEAAPALAEYARALHLGEINPLVYTCSNCGASSAAWQLQCPSCRAYATSRLDASKIPQTPATPPAERDVAPPPTEIAAAP